jgi:hypothetical protein
MNVSADQVRAATRSAAAVITEDKLPPLRLEEPAGSHEFTRRTRPSWAAPLAAAAAVVLVIAGSVVVGARLSGSGHGQPAAHAAAPPAGSLAGVPRYYVTFAHSSAVVRATATGATLASIPDPAPAPFAGVAGAADDRTFVLDAQRQVMGPTVTWPGQPVFYLLRLTASGAQKSLTRLAIPALPPGATVTGLAFSPDGSKLAVAVSQGSGGGRAGLLRIGVYTLATGAYRTWSTTGSTDSEAPNGFTGSGVGGAQSISWGGDSTTLAFDWENQSYVVGVRLLDTAASGSNLIADSRLAVVESDLSPRSGQAGSPIPPRDHASQCVTNAIMSLDGAAVVCGYSTSNPIGQSSVAASVRRGKNGRDTVIAQPGEGSYLSTTGFLRYSTTTGKPEVISVIQVHGQVPGDISLYWTDPTGHTLIGAVGQRGGVRVGVIRGDSFTPLPGIGYLGNAAW